MPDLLYCYTASTTFTTTTTSNTTTAAAAAITSATTASIKLVWWLATEQRRRKKRRSYILERLRLREGLPEPGSHFGYACFSLFIYFILFFLENDTLRHLII